MTGSNQYGERDTPLDAAGFELGKARPGAAGQDTALVVARRAQAVALRNKGMTYAEIAARIGYADKSNARAAVMAALEQVQADGVAQLREMEAARLDALQMAAWDKAMDGDLDAITVCRKLIESRAKLLGLNAPLQVELVGDVEEQLAALRVALAEDDPPMRIIEGQVA